MFVESTIRFSKLIFESAIIATVFVFSLRLFLKLACYLASRPWRRYRTFTIRRRRRWNLTAEKEVKSPSTFYCSICLQDATEGEKMRRLTACRHCYHAVCIDPWLEKRDTCPMCRAKIPTKPPGNPLIALIVPHGVIEMFTKGNFVSDAY
ncbi:unnamed protein product [Cochlearia groenlandica]